MPKPERRFWLMKTEPESFSFDDLWRAKGRRTGWDGVRNYQARNFMRDAMRVGDGVLVYHSSADPIGVAGVARIVTAAYPDPTQFDKHSHHHDPKARKEAPTWVQVDVEALLCLPRILTLAELKAEPELAGMALLQRGQRLSVQPVQPAEWGTVLRLAGLDPRAA